MDVPTNSAAWFAADAALAVERWRSELVASSVPSRFVPLAARDCRALLAAYSELYENENENEEAVDDAAERVRGVVRQLDAAIAAFGGAAFVKLSRSAKDVAYCEPGKALEKALAEALSAAGITGSETPSELANLELIAFMTAANTCLCVHSGAEAATLLFAKSTRVNQDMQRCAPACFKRSGLLGGSWDHSLRRPLARQRAGVGWL
eukprot:TRINITY_DN2126_c0_g1_i2.p1 TRINITY_DN2126_c0_g1~~TRINITY_DN2126_c0_g1_i2.p1  ORF type:complete len:234 (+),score=51.99 TRINITY_DN2126_c0_g1_i2:84-704(+)